MTRIEAAFREQARSSADLGSPLMARLHGLFAERLHPGTPIGERAHRWPGEPGGRGDVVPVRLAGALHALILDGSEPGLARAYAGAAALDDDALWAAVAAAMARHEARILDWLDRVPQTNEVRRSVALIAAAITSPPARPCRWC